MNDQTSEGQISYMGWDAGLGWELSMCAVRKRDGKDNMPRVDSTAALR